MRECADVEGNHRMDARHLSYIFWVTTAPFSRAITKGAQLEKLAPMTGRKAGLLWKATVDEKESGWRGGWMAFYFFSFFAFRVRVSFVLFGTCRFASFLGDAWPGRSFSFVVFYSLAACERS